MLREVVIAIDTLRDARVAEVRLAGRMIERLGDVERAFAGIAGLADGTGRYTAALATLTLLAALTAAATVPARAAARSLTAAAAGTARAARAAGTILACRR